MSFNETFRRKLPRKGQKVHSNLLLDRIQSPVGDEYVKERKKSSGTFLCFAIFDIDSEKEEIWFVRHDDGSIAAYYPYEVTLDGK